MQLQGASHEEGGIPVTDASTGQDTDVSLEGGEMVFSKEDSSALQQAVQQGDKEAVFNIVSANMQKEVNEGEMKNGGMYKKSMKMDWSGYKGKKKKCDCGGHGDKCSC